MSRGEVGRFLWVHWWQVGIIVVGLVTWVARVEGMVSRTADLEAAADLMESLGRLECLRDRQRATLAGVPCGQLLKEWGLR
jgi:hypothetical protein